MSNLIKSVVAINAKSTKDAEEFIDRVSGSSFFPRDNREDAEVFDFARIIPYESVEPLADDMMDLVGKSGIKYCWSEMNWGSVGNARDVSVELKSKVVVYDFHTKGYPPYLVAEKIRRMISSGELPKLEVDWKLIYEDGATVDMFEEIDRMDITQWGVAYETTLTSWIRNEKTEYSSGLILK